MSSLEPRNPTIAGHEYSNKTDAQVKKFKTVFMDMIKFLKQKTNDSLQEMYENKRKQWKEMK